MSDIEFGLHAIHTPEPEPRFAKRRDSNAAYTRASRNWRRPLNQRKILQSARASHYSQIACKNDMALAGACPFADIANTANAQHPTHPRPEEGKPNRSECLRIYLIARHTSVPSINRPAFENPLLVPGINNPNPTELEVAYVAGCNHGTASASD